MISEVHIRMKIKDFQKSLSVLMQLNDNSFLGTIIFCVFVVKYILKFLLVYTFKS